jgi:hypothetical protein
MYCRLRLTKVAVIGVTVVNGRWCSLPTSRRLDGRSRLVARGREQLVNAATTGELKKKVFG